MLGRYDYGVGARLFELGSLAAFTAAAGSFLSRVVHEASTRSVASTLAHLAVWSAVAFVASDFLSGVVHFLCDNFGTPDTPLVGQKFIKSFRDHHLDPLAMTHGDFVTVNADNTTACLPVLVPAAIWLDAAEHFGLAVFLCALITFVTITNQAHKWAHMEQLPAPVRWLQRAGLLLSKERHDLHHQPPFDGSYCITSGVLNPLLERLRFWTGLLRLAGKPIAAPS